MKVKLLTSRVGSYFSQSAGEVIDVPDDEGLRMIAAQGAIEVAAELVKPPEVPAVEPPAITPEANGKPARQKKSIEHR
jgi:hypothetical protein